MDEVDEYIRTAHESSGKIFFYTAGKSEIRVWQVDYGKPITNAAGQIHSDLERGFIRAEVYNMADFDKFSNDENANVLIIITRNINHSAVNTRETRGSGRLKIHPETTKVT